MTDWLTAAEIAARRIPGLPTTTRGVAKRAEKEHWPRRQRQASGGGWEYAAPVPPAPMPAQAALALPPPAHDENKTGLTVPAADAIPASPSQPAPSPDLAPGDGLAHARAWAVAACRRFAADRGLAETPGRIAFATAWSQGQLALPAWVRLAPPSATTLWRWTRTLDAEGTAALRRRPNLGRHRRFDADQETREVVLAMLTTHPHCSAGHILRALEVRVAQPPSFRSVQRWVRAWRATHPHLALAIVNPDAAKSRFRTAHGQADAGITAPNQLWEIDSTPGDVLLDDGRRHALIGVVDVATRRVLLHVARSSSSDGIAALLRRAIRTWGVPLALRHDNGADYCSHRIAAALVSLGIRSEPTPPFTPEAKPHIERAFGTLSRDLLELVDGYCGHDVAGRQAIEARQAFAARLFKTGSDAELRCSPQQLQELVDGWARDAYAHRPHDGLGGQTPFQAAAASRETVRRIENDRALDILLSPPADGRGLRRIGKKGISVDGTHYIAPELGGLEGTAVQVRLDEGDLGRIWVFRSKDDGGAYLCQAVAPELLGLDRRALALAARKTQADRLAEGKRELKAIARRQKVGTINAEILAHAREASASLVAFPPASVAHVTPDLVEAARAAAGRALPMPANEALPEPAVAPKTPQQREFEREERYYARACGLEQRLADGETLSDVDADWLEHARSSGWYRIRKSTAQQEAEFEAYVARLAAG